MRRPSGWMLGFHRLATFRIVNSSLVGEPPDTGMLQRALSFAVASSLLSVLRT